MKDQNLLESLSQLSDSLKLTFHLINRLSRLSFQPGSTPLNSDQGDVRVELSHDIRDALKQHDDSLDALRQEVEDWVGLGAANHRRRDSLKDRERARVAAQLARLQEDLKHARSQFRAAQLTAKRASEEAKKKEREIVFATLQQPPQLDSTSSTPDHFTGRRTQHTKQLTQDELLINASTDVTSALRRTHNLLTSELSRSRFAQETLDQSTAALADLGERYTDLDSLLSNSRTLLGTLVKSQKSDTWYLETAFYILITTICWLVFRRLIYGPAWWFIWLPLKFFIFKPFYFIFAAFGIKTGSTASLRPLTETTGSRPLRVLPSASGPRPRFPSNMQRQGGGIPVGGGGAGAKVGQGGERLDPSPQGSLSQKIGQMAEADREEVPSNEDSKDLPRRGDGTVLQKRGDIPRNPKKKMFEADVESAKHETRKRDEL